MNHFSEYDDMATVNSKVMVKKRSFFVFSS